MKTLHNTGAPAIRTALSIPAGISFLSCSLLSILVTTGLNAQINVASGETYVINSDAQLGADNVIVENGGTAELADGVTVLGNDASIAGNGVSFGGALRAATDATAEWGGGVSLSTAVDSRIGTNGAGELTVSGTISGGTTSQVLWMRTNGGTLVLSGDNTFNNSVQVTASTGNTTRVVVESNTAFGGTAQGTTTAVGTSIQLADGVVVTGEWLTPRGTGTSSEGTLTTTMGSSATWDGEIRLSGATDAGIGAQGGTLSVDGVVSFHLRNWSG